MREKILFVCIGNSCRSQMAEGFTNAFFANKLQAHSAGIRPSTLDPLAVEVMAEVGIDISKSKAKTIDSLADVTFDYVVSVCDSGMEECPFIAASKKTIHQGFADPPKLTADIEDKEEKLGVYRSVREEIRQFVEGLEEQLYSA
jgi:arsenate reductase